MKESIKDQAILWVAKEKEGLNSQEKQNLNTWLEKDKLHEEAFINAKAIYTVFNNLPKNEAENLSKKAHESVKREKVFIKLRPLFAYAAALLLVIMLSFKSYEYLTPSFETIYLTKNETPKHNSLPDGSIISLDAKSSLDVKYYANKREVVLNSGQAVFDVAKDKNRPFIISSGRSVIEVLGTKFEVQKNKNTTTVNVIEGLVKVSHVFNNGEKTKAITQLRKGEKIVLDDLGKVSFLGKTKAELIATWQSGKLIFNKSSLANAIKTFSKYSDKKINFDKQLETYLFSGKFKVDEFDKFLNALEKVYSLKVERKEKSINIVKK